MAHTPSSSIPTQTPSHQPAGSLPHIKLSVIVPVYNERGTVVEVLNRVKQVPIAKEIIVVDNCSTDGTRELLQEIDDPDITIVFQPENLGKGSSVRVGIQRARGEYVIVQDADLEYDPDDYPRLLNPAEAKNLPAVYGSRTMENADQTGSHPFYYFGRRFLTWVFRCLYGVRLTDVATCYKLIRTSVAQTLPLQCHGFDLDFEITAMLCRLGYPIHEVPIRYRPRSVEEGKKIRVFDGVTALWTLLKCRFGAVVPS